MASTGDEGDDSGEPTASSEQATADSRASGPVCPHCQAPLYNRHCKYVCPQHGVVIDCSDPFL
ncbi:hypothetical protein EA462_03895 [Natrarchaeobius halalkaliphilus]|uniref:Small CPxCG-related zinc finger protein n=1 Tax=Natrarchaeobius halalkaliphilus TaxID=1679091 RepID=A0A3N6LRS4_9EURY|nr:HVO_2523 family zinc finger protein [Natrarchaeobius halalkaliphilus]RQG91147.1 hypothetical protein EA462_03895 [Natrarchaeobius halalkaliphilus]